MPGPKSHYQVWRPVIRSQPGQRTTIALATALPGSDRSLSKPYPCRPQVWCKPMPTRSQQVASETQRTKVGHRRISPTLSQACTPIINSYFNSKSWVGPQHNNQPSNTVYTVSEEMLLLMKHDCVFIQNKPRRFPIKPAALPPIMSSCDPLTDLQRQCNPVPSPRQWLSLILQLSALRFRCMVCSTSS